MSETRSQTFARTPARKGPLCLCHRKAASGTTLRGRRRSYTGNLSGQQLWPAHIETVEVICPERAAQLGPETRLRHHVASLNSKAHHVMLVAGMPHKLTVRAGEQYAKQHLKLKEPPASAARRQGSHSHVKCAREETRR